MRTIAALARLAAVTASLAAAPARPAPPEEPWARVGDWLIWPFIPGACDARRHYPGGMGMTLRKYAGGEGQLIVTNRGLSGLVPRAYRLTLVQGGRRRPLAVPRPVQSLFHGVWAQVATDGMAALTAGATLEIEALDGRLIERTDLADLAPALDRVGACLAANPVQAPTTPPPLQPPRPGKRGEAQPARASANLAALFSSDDYPSAALQAKEQGAVGFRLRIDKAGRVERCDIIASSGSSTLDSTTCQLLAERARFTPARDGEGRPVPDSMTGRIVWRIPKPEPPPPPPDAARQ